MKLTLTKATPLAVKDATAAVDLERDRRAEQGFIFAGKLFQARQQDLLNMVASATYAGEARANGAQPGDIFWGPGGTPFAWIAYDNSLVPMDAFQMGEFAATAMAFRSNLIMKGRAIKNLIEAGDIGLDPTSDGHWS